MEIFAISFVVICLAFLGMALGVLFGRPPPAAGCGGAGQADGCEACSPDRGRRAAASARQGPPS